MLQKLEPLQQVYYWNKCIAIHWAHCLTIPHVEPKHRHSLEWFKSFVVCDYSEVVILEHHTNDYAVFPDYNLVSDTPPANRFHLVLNRGINVHQIGDVLHFPILCLSLENPSLQHYKEDGPKTASVKKRTGLKKEERKLKLMDHDGKENGTSYWSKCRELKSTHHGGKKNCGISCISGWRRKEKEPLFPSWFSYLSLKSVPAEKMRLVEPLSMYHHTVTPVIVICNNHKSWNVLNNAGNLDEQKLTGIASLLSVFMNFVIVIRINFGFIVFKIMSIFLIKKVRI